MTQILLRNARIVLEDRIVFGAVQIRDGRIDKLFAHQDAPTGLSASEAIDLGGALLAPGIIDIHIHGSAGIDVQDTDADGLSRLSEFLLSEGVTGYFATFVPASDDCYRAAIAAICSYNESQDQAAPTGKRRARARILGIHFEGPFVSEQRCGALQRRYFRTYDGNPDSLAIFLDGSGGAGQQLMTLAPEVGRRIGLGVELTRELTRRGVRVFIGHTEANPETLDLAFEAGARHITHFPNALEPLHHRKPGAVGWGLVRQDVTMDCIADFQHVDPLMLRLIYQTKGADRMGLISDAIKPAGLGDGEFLVWGDRVAVRLGRTALADGPAKGTIAGSVMTMRQALKNIISLGISIPEACRMASLVPARVTGFDQEYGSIALGKRADLVAIDDDFELRLAIVGGTMTAVRM